MARGLAAGGADRRGDHGGLQHRPAPRRLRDRGRSDRGDGRLVRKMPRIDACVFLFNHFFFFLLLFCGVCVCVFFFFFLGGGGWRFLIFVCGGGGNVLTLTDSLGLDVLVFGEFELYFFGGGGEADGSCWTTFKKGFFL